MSIQAEKTKAQKVSLAAASAMLLVGAGCNSQPEANVNSVINEPNGDTGTDAGAEATSYRDGEYTVTGHYTSPAGPETIKVTLTLQDSIVTDAEVVSEATHQISIMRQGEFVGGYKAQVIGKNLNEVNVGKVAGSSLTPKGFNEAVEQIKAQAAM